MPLEITTIVVGPLETNSYVIACGATLAVVDPGIAPTPLLQVLAGREPQVAMILLTHGHGDHIAGTRAVKSVCPQAGVHCPAGDAAMLSDTEQNLSAMFGLQVAGPEPDELLHPGDVLSIGGARWQILDTSGHTPGGISYYCSEAGVVLTGDALFCGSIGRTDIPGADPDRLRQNIREHVLTLPEDTRVLPGHGPPTTIRRERLTNPFVGAKPWGT